MRRCVSSYVKLLCSKFGDLETGESFLFTYPYGLETLGSAMIADKSNFEITLKSE